MTDDSGHGPKSVTFNENGRSRSVGTTGHVQSESAVNLERNTHEPTEIVNNAVAIDYVLELTSGVTGRIVELLRQSARVALGRQAAQLSVADLQHAGMLFAADIGSERNVSH